MARAQHSDRFWHPGGSLKINVSMLGWMRRLLRRRVDRLAAPYVADVHGHLADQDDRLRELASTIGVVHRDFRQTGEGMQGLATRWEDRTEHLFDEISQTRMMLRHIYEEDAAQRQRLYALRNSDEYEAAFSESEPLVSFVIPTYNRFESLRDTALPSILAQTYSNIEVVVVGDGSPPETEQVIAELDDPRVRYYNRSVRGPYPSDRSVRWYMIGTPPYNDAVALVRGRWIAALGDDDAVRPQHAEILLQSARDNRFEHCYGRHLVHYRSGETLEVGSFPPIRGEYVLQTALYHAGLSFFQMEPADYLYEEPNDWSLCRRMLQAGVRFGMVDDILADKYESRYEKHADWGIHGVPPVD